MILFVAMVLGAARAGAAGVPSATPPPGVPSPDPVAPASLVLDVAAAMERAGAHRRAVARADLASADADLDTARAPFDPAATLGGGYTASTDEGASQFGRFFAETSGWRSSLGLAQTFTTGTTLNVDLAADQSRFLYRLAEGDLEVTDEPQYRSRLALQVSQALLEGASRRYNRRALRAAQRGRTTATAQALLDEDRACLAAARAYREARRRQKLEEIAREALAVANEQARVVTELVGAGRLAAVESTRARGTVLQAELALLDAGNARADALDALLVAMGDPPGTPVLLADSVGEVRAVALELTPEAVTAAIDAQNVELALARNAEAVAAGAVQDARHGLLPTLAATGGLGVAGYEPSLDGALSELAGGQLRDWNAGLTLSLPLGNRADRAALARAEAQLARARAAREELERGLGQQAASQLRLLASATRRLDLTAANERLARETLAAETARLAEGRALPRDVAAAAQALTQAQGEAAAALQGWLDAHDGIRFLTGTLGEP